MSIIEAPAPSVTLTAEYLANLPDDGVERDLIRGELRGWPMTLRDPMHTESEMSIGYELRRWLEGQPRRGARSSAERRDFACGRIP